MEVEKKGVEVLMRVLYSFKIFDYGREKRESEIKVNINMYIGYGLRSVREEEVEKIALGLAVTITNLQCMSHVQHFHFLVSMLEQ